jgi:hypothetical protein
MTNFGIVELLIFTCLRHILESGQCKVFIVHFLGVPMIQGKPDNWWKCADVSRYWVSSLVYTKLAWK